jgi:3-hydroxyacyl-CoA dehydrogenase
VLKHRLEDHQRWKRDVVALDVRAEQAEQARDDANANLEQAVKKMVEQAMDLQMGKEAYVALTQALKAALDCDSHFHKPDLKVAWTDADFTIDFEKSKVVCEQCVERLTAALTGAQA